MRDRRFYQVFQHREVRKEIEVLKHIAHVDPLLKDLLLFQFKEFVALTAIANVVAVNLDKTFVDALQVVNGAQQRRFARPGWPEDHRHGPWRDLKRDVVEGFMATEIFTDAGNRNMSFRRGLHGRAPVLAWR